MDIKDQFLSYAADFAQNAGHRVAELDRKLASLQEEERKIQAQRDMARSALQRLSNYPITDGADYLCPQCWIARGAMTPMRPLSSQMHNDLFRCALCHLDLEIEP